MFIKDTFEYSIRTDDSHWSGPNAPTDEFPIVKFFACLDVDGNVIFSLSFDDGICPSKTECALRLSYCEWPEWLLMSEEWIAYKCDYRPLVEIIRLKSTGMTLGERYDIMFIMPKETIDSGHQTEILNLARKSPYEPDVVLSKRVDLLSSLPSSSFSSSARPSSSSPPLMTYSPSSSRSSSSSPPQTTSSPPQTTSSSSSPPLSSTEMDRPTVLQAQSFWRSTVGGERVTSTSKHISTFVSNDTNAGISICSNNPNSNRGRVSFGQPDTLGSGFGIWENGSASDGDKKDDYYVWRVGKPALIISNDASIPFLDRQLVEAPYGVKTKRIDLDPSPRVGHDTTLWCNRNNNNRAVFGSNTLAYISDIPKVPTMSSTMVECIPMVLDEWRFGGRSTIPLRVDRFGSIIHFTLDPEYVYDGNDKSTRASMYPQNPKGPGRGIFNGIGITFQLEWLWEMLPALKNDPPKKMSLENRKAMLPFVSLCEPVDSNYYGVKNSTENAKTTPYVMRRRDVDGYINIWFNSSALNGCEILSPLGIIISEFDSNPICKRWEMPLSQTMTLSL